ncbi:hypothetical protein MRX96_043621 [Rhipicephalus microplus]
MTRVLYSFFVSLAMGFYAATHVFTPMVEWCSGIKHLQLMTGMSGCLYWMGHFVFDAIEALCNSATLASIILRMVGSLGVELLSVITQDHPTVVSSAALFLWGFVCRWFPTYALRAGHHQRSSFCPG